MTGRVDLDRLASDVEVRLLALPRARKRDEEIVYSCMLGDRHRNGDSHPSASYSIPKKAWCCQGCGASGGLVKGEHPIAQLLGIDADAYRVNGATPRQRSGRPDRPPDHSWHIKDAHGTTIATHHRWNLPSGEKAVRWETPDNPFGLGGRKVETLPLYASDRVGEREPGDDAPIIVCEGEPATDALLELGLRAVGTVTGASSVPVAQVLEVLRSADVVLWPDADEPGQAHMAQLAARLEGVAASVRVFAPEGLSEGGDAADWTRARISTPNLATVLMGEIEEHARRTGEPERTKFEALPDDVGFRLEVPALSAVLEVTQLRREKYHLKGEILCRCNLPGAAVFDGVLNVGDVNLSSGRTKAEHARYLAEQARTEQEPWRDALEEFSQRVLAAQREGDPDVDLSEVKPSPVRVIEPGGLPLPRNHPSITFGDGDSMKSLFGLYGLGCLSGQGLRVGLVDWEMAPDDHAERLAMLFPGDVPRVRYLRCNGSIVHEGDRIRRWARTHKLDFLLFDSVAFACGGDPSKPEIATGYFSVVRSLGERGSLHVAHTTKNAENADRRPFGSTFWHNGARATWFADRATREPGSSVSRIAFHPRKWNHGALPSARGFEIDFAQKRATVRPVPVADIAELAVKLPVKQRMVAALASRGPLTAKEMAEELDVPENTIRVTASRSKERFNLESGVLCLVEGGSRV